MTLEQDQLAAYARHEIKKRDAEIERLRAALADGAQRIMNLAPKDGKTDATAYIQIAVDLNAAARSLEQ